MTPAAVERQIALWSASALVLPQLLSLVPTPPRLMLATLMLSAAAFAVTQSMPQITCAQVPEPLASSTFTA